MDWHTFIRSAQAIAPFWEYQAMTGLSGIGPSDALKHLRYIGVEMERKMFAATRASIPTRDLFSSSLLLYGAGYSIYSKTEHRKYRSHASAPVKGLVSKELGQLAEKTFRQTDNCESCSLCTG